MKRLKFPLAALSLAVAQLARAAGDSGTGGVGEMNLTGTQFLMLIGAVAVVGVVLWLVGKYVSK